MPELPEVEAVVRSLREDGLENARITSATVHRTSTISPQTIEEFTRRCRNRTIVNVERRAKNILLHVSGELVLRIHLRMTGDLKIGTAKREEERFTRIEWRLDDRRVLRFSDPRCLGRVHLLTEADLAHKLLKTGIEPLSRAFTSAKFAELAATSRLPSKLFLMDQTKVAGLGNIYAAEALFRAHIAPTAPMNTIEGPALARLHKSIRDVLRVAVQSVYKAYRSPGGYRNHRDDFHRMVYGQAGAPCQVCGQAISRIRQGGRSTYFCGNCQR